MLKIILTGCLGRMGRAIIEYCHHKSDVTIVAGLDTKAPNAPLDFPVYTHPDAITEAADVIIDFSVPSATIGILKIARARNLGMVIATTGFTDEQLATVMSVQKEIPLVLSGNMSVGVHVMAHLCKQAAQLLGEDYDIECIEQHHNKKVDAPSGTAKLIVDAIQSGLSEPMPIVTDRTQRRIARPKKEIGMHTIRGGSIVGEHEIVFAGNLEVIRIAHSAGSRELFASGAVRLAKALCGKPAGYYDVTELILQG
jgi:4-hydroxy-tetrahydrodipicolinate reductase